jgi:hypothetical protein
MLSGSCREDLKRISTLFCEGKILRAYDAFEISEEGELLNQWIEYLLLT